MRKTKKHPKLEFFYCWQPYIIFGKAQPARCQASLFRCAPTLKLIYLAYAGNREWRTRIILLKRVNSDGINYLQLLRLGLIQFNSKNWVKISWGIDRRLLKYIAGREHKTRYFPRDVCLAGKRAECSINFC